MLATAAEARRLYPPLAYEDAQRIINDRSAADKALAVAAQSQPSPDVSMIVQGAEADQALGNELLDDWGGDGRGILAQADANDLRSISEWVGRNGLALSDGTRLSISNYMTLSRRVSDELWLACDPNGRSWKPLTDNPATPTPSTTVAWVSAERSIWLGSVGPRLHVSNEIRTGPAEESLSFSPDGRRLVFQEGRTVWIAAADGSDSRPLTPAGQQWIAPSWSPDSTSLLVTRRLGPGQWVLARVSVDSRVVADLTSPVPFRLSPNAAYLDRDHLLIVAPDANLVPQVLITSANATGGRLFATAQGCGFAMPQVSPDGRTVLLDATCDTPGMNGLWVVPSSGGVPHQVVSGHVGAPTWGPNSGSILFGYVRIGQPDDSPELWLTTLNGKGARQLLGTWPSWPAAKSAT